MPNLRATIGDLARALEPRVYVDRPGAQTLFTQLLASDEGFPSVLFVCAPGGSGKSICLRLFEAQARQQGVQASFVDARDVPADARAAELAMAQAVQKVSDGARGVVFVDTFEAHQALERVYREHILLRIPRHVRVVLAGRQAPDRAWAHDPVWSRLMLTHKLPLLTRDEARALLDARQAPSSDHEALISLARGHALTLACLAAEGHDRGRPFRAGASHLAELAKPLPLDEKLAILTLCLGHWVEESDLMHIAGTGSFLPQLERLPFVECSGARWRIHELYRDGFLARLRAELAAELPGVVRRSIGLIMARVQKEADFELRVRMHFEVGFLLRALPHGDGLYDLFHADPYYRDALRPDDVPSIVSALERFEGPTCAALAKEHLARFPDLCLVLRDPDGAPIAVIVWMDAERLTEDDVRRDPAAARLHALANGGPSHLVRWWFVLETYQAPSAAFSHITAYASATGFARVGSAFHGHVIHTLTPASGAAWHALGLLDRIRELEFTLDGHAHTVLGYDFRSESPHARMVSSIQRMLEIAALAEPPMVRSPPRSPTFTSPPANLLGAVIEALRWYRYDDRLGASQLAEALSVDNPVERATRTRALLDEAHRRLRPTGRTPEPAALIQRSYFEREEKQLAIARDLGLAHGTYRRRLREAVSLLTVCVEAAWTESAH